MIIALGMPAYRQTLHVQTAYAWSQDAITALELGWRPFHLWVDATGITRARNIMVQKALDAGARMLLTCDSDTFPLAGHGGLGALWKTMQRLDAAVVGAAVITRNGTRMNCEPARPGECYEGEVGTGYMLIDLFKLRELPRPWFVQHDAPDGQAVVCGEDIAFCRAARAAGHRVIVDFTIAMGHADQSIAASDPGAAASTTP